MNTQDFYIVGIGASAGGHEALQKFLRSLPSKPDIAFVVVTHILRNHESKLHAILAKYTAMKVVRIEGFEVVRPNHIYVMPENVSVTIKNQVLLLRPRNDNEVINKMVDKFFHSLALDQKERAVGIIFSGMGSDGAKGAQAIHNNGGTVLVQEPSSTLYSSMPWATINADHPQEILPPEELGKRLVEILRMKAVNMI